MNVNVVAAILLLAGVRGATVSAGGDCWSGPSGHVVCLLCCVCLVNFLACEAEC